MGKLLMLDTKILKVLLAFVCFSVAACSLSFVDRTPQESSGLIFYANPDPLKGRQDVYNSMARAAKYNVDIEGNNLNKDVSERLTRQSVDVTIEDVIKANIDDENNLYQASRVLEYAISYAVAGLSENKAYTDNYFYEVSAQKLALQAIKSHQNAWYASKSIKNLDRLYRKEQKIVADLDAKEKRVGSLSDAEYDYRKNQEVLLLRISELRNNQQYLLQDYANLIKAEPKDVELEGRRFYELENFDKDYSIELFQEAAVRNRKEFALTKEKVGILPYSQVRNHIITRYPLVSRLDVNGLKVENEIYEQSLYEKAMKISKDLMSAVKDVKNIQIGNMKYALFMEEAFDKLGAAVLTQSEIDYQLVMLADTNYEVALRAEIELKKELHRIEKIKHPSNEDKLSLLNVRIALNEMEQHQAKLKAERAEALRKLYFDAGLSPLSTTMLKAPIKDVAIELKRAFNKDLVTMLAGVKDPIDVTTKVVKNEDKGWAQKPNWLEETVAKGLPKKEKSVRKTNIKMLQLGSYLERSNADVDWKVLSDRFPQLKYLVKRVEPTELGGKMWYRLTVEGDAQNLRAICSSLQSAGFECLPK